MRSRALVVAAREFSATVRSPSYIFTTLGMPIIMGLIALVGALPSLYIAVKEASADRGPFALVDGSGVLREDPRWSTPPLPPAPPRELGGRLARLWRAPLERPVEIHRYPDVEAAKRAIREGKVRGAIVVPRDYLETGAVAIYEDRKGGELAGRADPGSALRTVLVDGLLAADLDAARRARVERPVVERRRFRLQEDGTFRPDDPLERLSKLAVPLAFTVFLLLAIFTSAGFLMQGVAEEKENRVLEVMLSAISARELLAGKLLGLGGAGLLQIAVWSAGVVAPAARLLPFVEVRPGLVAIAIAYFALGYLLFGSLVLGFGSLGGNYRESQQWSAAFSVAGGVMPALFLPVVIDEPGGVLARIVSLVPPTSPVCMTVRASLERVPLAEIAVSLVLTALAVAVALRVAARIYRAGTLMTGKRATLAEVWKALRAREP